MKKIIIAFIAVALIIASVFGAIAIKNKVSEKNGFKINATSSLYEVVDFYNSSVKTSKDNQNFGLDVTTSVKLDEINSSSKMLNEMLSAIMGYQAGDVRTDMRSFVFENGVDTHNTEATPFSVIQPASSYIEGFNEAALLNQSVLFEEDNALLSFEIKNESADLDSVIAAINPIIKGQTVTDKSAITALAPNHSAFIDVGDIMSTVVDMLGISDMVNSSDGDNKENKSASGSKSIGINGGECVIGNTEIAAYADSDGILYSVMITVPVELRAGFKLMNNVIETSIRITVTQTYMFNYS
ncbi:MAG: hypothetical protein HDT34_00230 [Clostridiales bacterium]|nr:hypothetical protein [Clostridiales bacterium]